MQETLRFFLAAAFWGETDFRGPAPGWGCKWGAYCTAGSKELLVGVSMFQFALRGWRALDLWRWGAERGVQPRELLVDFFALALLKP